METTARYQVDRINSNDELSQTVETLKRRIASLERRNEKLKQFVYHIAHDLQQPLLTLHGFAALLREQYTGHLDQEADDFLSFMVDDTMPGGSPFRITASASRRTASSGSSNSSK